MWFARIARRARDDLQAQEFDELVEILRIPVPHSVLEVVVDHEASTLHRVRSIPVSVLVVWMDLGFWHVGGVGGVQVGPVGGLFEPDGGLA